MNGNQIRNIYVHIYIHIYICTIYESWDINGLLMGYSWDINWE
jgi:hypothetical protein